MKRRLLLTEVGSIVNLSVFLARRCRCNVCVCDTNPTALLASVSWSSLVPMRHPDFPELPVIDYAALAAFKAVANRKGELSG